MTALWNAIGFASTGLIVAVVVLVVRPLRREAAELCRLAGRAFTGQLPSRKVVPYTHAADPRFRAAHRRWMDLHLHETRSDRRWMKREFKKLARIAELYMDAEESSR